MMLKHFGIFSLRLTFLFLSLSVFMSTVSPVFHTEATVSIGLKNVFRVGTFIPYYLGKIYNSHSAIYTTPRKYWNYL